MSGPSAPNAADPKLVEKAKLKDRFSRRQQIEDIKFLLEKAAFRRICWAVLSRCGIYRLSYTGGAETYFNEGKRDIGLFIHALIEQADPDALVTMIKEARIKEES